MKQKLTFLSITLTVFLICGTVQSQDNNINGGRWNLPSTRAYTGGVYSQLPSVNTYKGPTGTTRIYHTSFGDILVPPNIIPFPTTTATESEVAAVNSGGNTNTMFAAWNSYGPSFYGTGFSLTTNGGTSFTGSYNTMNPANNGGDPGPWVWPAGSTWAGRLGMSILNGAYTGVNAFYSTDNGVTWTAGISIPPTGSVDKNLACVDDVPGSPYFGRAYILWSNFSAGQPPIVGAFSSDGGATWVPSTGNVSPASDGSHYCQGVDVQVGPGGIVYAVWAMPISGSPYTEDYIGFAKSTNGGVTWTSGTNTAVNVNGIRTTALYNGIRADGFPRLAIDKSGGARNGWIYAVLSEKTVAPARDNSDVCLCRSTDGGTTWTHTLVNQDASGNYNWLPAPVVDNNGILAISYYDTRNTTVPLTQFYMSYSNDGGATYTDVQISDHSFTPAPIPGLAGGYQGDYTGITCGNGKFWPYWAESSSGHYQVWTAGTSLALAHDFACGPFLSLPVAPLYTNTPYNIKSKISNIGTSNETAVPVKYYVDGVLINTTNVNENAGAVDSVSNTWQSAVAGNHTLMYITALASDLNRVNDTVRTTVTLIALVPPLCEQFSTTTFPPTGWTVDGTWWGYNAVSGFGVGTGSARFNSYSAPAGTDNNLKTLTFAVLPDAVLRFDIAFSPYPATPPYQQDSLVVLGSSDGGATYYSIIRLGPEDMQTAPATSGEFTPIASQWGKLSYPLPNGTNEIDFLGRSQYGNDLFIDSVCIDHLIGIASHENNVPKIYSLSQNYPNPFNPTTVINFGLPKAGLVKLVVYDIIGRVVATLVNNEFKEAGNYKVDFNALNLSSGVYFYRIETGSFTDIKKMVLIK